MPLWMSSVAPILRLTEVMFVRSAIPVVFATALASVYGAGLKDSWDVIVVGTPTIIL